MGTDGLLAEAVARLVEIVARLRGEGGCPWDREQTHATLRPYVIEEAHEVVEALDAGEPARIREELGDLLFQVVLHSQLGAERGEFDLAAVAAGLAEKLVRRHPHVFGEERARQRARVDGLPRPEAEEHAPLDAATVEKRWEHRKREERAAAAKEKENENEKEGGSVLAGVPVALPALARAQKVQERAARVGFDWKDVSGPLEKLDEERGELARAIASRDPRAIEQELGDLLFTVVNVARACKVNAEDALRGTVQKFTRRFRHVEEAAARSGRDVHHLSLEEMDRLWDEAKAAER